MTSTTQGGRRILGSLGSAESREPVGAAALCLGSPRVLLCRLGHDLTGVDVGP